MLVNVHHDTPGEHRRLFVAGVGFLSVIALLITGSIAIYNKWIFSSVATVKVNADRAGLQLPKFGDVRMHGVIVGQIRGVSQSGDHATITLGLDPEMIKSIPDNVSVEIRPTTLFGQKYVQFNDPPDAWSTTSLKDGDVISASRVQTTVELEAVLARLYPLLTAVRPADLSVTLNSLARGLMGRGEDLGKMLTTLNSYLTTMNVQLPTLQRDLQKFAAVAREYSLSAPDLITIMRNATVTARTVSSHEPQLASILGDFTALSNDASTLLLQNGNQIITEARLAVPIAKLLDVYAPEYPCLLKGLARYSTNLSRIFQHERVSQTMILSGKQQSAYKPSERPVYAGIGHGPWCLGLPSIKKMVPGQPNHVADGSDPGRRP